MLVSLFLLNKLRLSYGIMCPYTIAIRHYFEHFKNLYRQLAKYLLYFCDAKFYFIHFSRKRIVNMYTGLYQLSIPFEKND